MVQCHWYNHIKQQMYFFIPIYFVKTFRCSYSLGSRRLGMTVSVFRLISLCQPINLSSLHFLLIQSKSHPSIPANRGPSQPLRTVLTLIQMCQTCLNMRLGIIRPQAGNTTMRCIRLMKPIIRLPQNKIFKASKAEQI